MNVPKNSILAAALLLSACGDPQQAAQTKIAEVSKALASAPKDLDPLHRLDTYDQLLEDVKSIGQKYAETATGSAIASGRSVDGVSLGDLQATRDALAERAKCYANPTVECLTPFGSAGANGSAQSQDAIADAGKLICERGFSAADRSIANFKINKPVYAKELIQLALAAAECKKPDDVKAAIGAYMAAAPTANGERLNSLMSILATPSLEPGWPMVLNELESELKSGAISGNAAANVTLTLALDYARMGKLKAALAKYTYFTDTLHYRADATSTDELAVAVMLSGDAATAMKIASGDGNPNYAIIQTHKAANALGKRMALTDDGGSPDNVVNALSDDATIKDYFVPVDAQTKARDEKTADTIEGQLDKLAPTATLKVAAGGQALSFGVGIDTAYAIVAVVRQKLGQPDKAAAALKKGLDLRVRLLGKANATTGQLDDYRQFISFSVLMHLAQNDAATAARLAKAVNLNNYGYSELILASSAAATGDAAQALSIRAELGNMLDDYHAFVPMIAGLTRAGKPDQAEKLIAAYPGNPAQKANFYWPVVERMIAGGDAKGARSYAEKHALIKDERGKLSFDARLLQSEKIAADRGKAEPIIREMFQIGQDMDKGSGASFVGGSDHYVAQNAAASAFKNGYTDLGIELYQAAVNRDQRPLLVAFTDNMKKADMSRVLMLAQDNVSGDRLAYVVDRAIRHLENKAAR